MKVRMSLKNITFITLMTLIITIFFNSSGMVEILNAYSDTNNKEIKKSVYARETVQWWKADLSIYDDNFSLIKYELSDEKSEEAGIEFAFEETTSLSVPPETEAVTETHPETAPPAESIPAVPPARSSGDFIFTTYGYGHGVGLSQNGANAYAIYKGYNYEQILKHYYSGVTIANTGTAETETITVDGVTGSVMELLPLVVSYEISSDMHPEAIKAQAVAAYTYIKYHGGGRDLRMRSSASEKIVNLCLEVLGQACYYNGGFAMTMFYSSSGGASASCKDVFVQDIPYLVSVSGELDSLYDGHYGTVKVMGEDSVRSKIESQYNIQLSNDPSNWFVIIEGGGGYAANVVIDGKITVKGNDFRTCLGLKSPKFTFTYS